jgi:Ca2+-binding RTX toxin-like protein
MNATPTTDSGASQSKVLFAGLTPTNAIGEGSQATTITISGPGQAPTISSSGLYFNGSSQLNIQDSDLLLGSSNFEIKFKFKTNNTTPYSNILNTVDNSILGIANDPAYGGFIRAWAGNNVLYSNANVNDNEWHILNFKRISNKLTLSIDEKIQSTTEIQNDLEVDLSNFVLGHLTGQWSHNWDNSYIGWISDFEISTGTENQYHEGTVIAGTDKEDTITGSAGNDTINGNGGSDHISGGLGADIFQINFSDTIDDLNINDGDKIDLTNILSKLIGFNQGENPFEKYYLDITQSSDGKNATTYINYDLDGNGSDYGRSVLVTLKNNLFFYIKPEYFIPLAKTTSTGNPDIIKYSIQVDYSSELNLPLVKFSIKLSENFSNANSIVTQYQSFNGGISGEITLIKNEQEEYYGIAQLPKYTSSGWFLSGALFAQDNSGVNLVIDRHDIAISGGVITSYLNNPYSDDISPSIENIKVESIEYGNSAILAHLSLFVSENESGLAAGRTLGIRNSSGRDFGATVNFDTDGNGLATFQFSKYAKSETYTISGSSIMDLAGNAADSSILNKSPVTFTLNNPNEDTDLPSLSKFKISAEFSSSTGRPFILTSGDSFDATSGVSTVTVVLRSPTNNYYGSGERITTFDQLTKFENSIPLINNFTPGEYLVDQIVMTDIADNMVKYSGEDLKKLNFPDRISIYFPIDSEQTNIKGSVKSDFIFGTDKTNDTLDGAEGNDVLYSGDGNDVVDAGEGDDLIIGGSGAGDDIYFGGKGVDTVKYTSARAGLAIDLVKGYANSIDVSKDSGIGKDSLSDIESLISGEFNDLIISDNANNLIEGMSGDDTIISSSGSDTLIGGNGIDKIVFEGIKKSYSIQKSIDKKSFTISSSVNAITTAIDFEYFEFNGITYTSSQLLSNSFNINAKIKTWKGDPLAGVKIFENDSRISSSLGIAELAEIDDTDGNSDGIITIAPSKITPSTILSSGISLTDVLSALKIYLGKSLPETVSSPFNYIAADFDANGTVNLTDVLSLLKFYLGKNSTSQPSWVFIDAADMTGTGSSSSIAGMNGQPISKTYAIPKLIQHDLSTDSTVELIGVLRGDVDGSWSG